MRCVTPDSAHRHQELMATWMEVCGRELYGCPEHIYVQAGIEKTLLCHRCCPSSSYVVAKSTYFSI